MNYLQICGVSLCAAFLSLLCRESGSRIAPLVGIFSGIFLFLYLLGDLSGILEKLIGLSEAYHVSGPIKTALQAVGIGAVTEISSGICRDLSENGIATRLEMCGKITVLLLALPTILEVLELALEVAS